MSAKFASKGRYIALPGGGGFGPQAIFTMSLLPSLPGASDLSTERIVTTLGSAIVRGSKPIYSVRMPQACPLQHLAFKAALTFAEGGNEATPVTVPASYDAPCPKKRRRRKRLA